jgi:DNA-directed RNA polymerase sigma subunit (sigma70/sigma32)
MNVVRIPDTLDRPDVMLDAHTSLPHCEVIRRLRFLSEAERHVIVLRRGLAGRPRGVLETAAMLSISPEQVESIDAVACAKLLHPAAGEPVPHAHRPPHTPAIAA